LVPDFLSLTASEARQLGLRSNVLVVAPDGETESVDHLDGLVCRQEPSPGLRVEFDTNVTVWTAGHEGEAGVREPRRPSPPGHKLRGNAELDDDPAM
jgi:hypothetical protein